MIKNLKIGYIYLVPDSENGNIENDIKECIRTHKVSILEEDGTVKMGCPVLNFNSTDLTYPEKYGEYGSCVLLAYPEKSSVPVIMGILPTNSEKENAQYKNKNQKRYVKNTKDYQVSITQDADKGILDLSVFGKDKAEINIKSNTKDSKGKIKIQAQENIELESFKDLNIKTQDTLEIKIKNVKNQEKFTTIKYKLTEGLTITDEFENIITLNKDGMVITLKKDIIINADGNANINVKGNCNADIKGNSNIKSPNVKITGGKVQIGNNPKPATGFCGTPVCFVTGAPLTTNTMPSE